MEIADAVDAQIVDISFAIFVVFKTLVQINMEASIARLALVAVIDQTVGIGHLGTVFTRTLILFTRLVVSIQMVVTGARFALILTVDVTILARHS